MSIPVESIRFTYIRNEHGDPIATVAYKLVAAPTPLAEDGTEIHVGAAFCSPRDVFHKKQGRLIAEARMHKNPSVGVVPFLIRNDVFAIRNLAIELAVTWDFDSPAWCGASNRSILAALAELQSQKEV